MTQTADKFETQPNSCDSPRLLSTEERQSVRLKHTDGTDQALSVEQDRITFNRASQLVLQNGIGRVDHDEEEFDDFFHPERGQESGKRFICEHLDELETAETFNDVDINALDVVPKRESTVWGRLGRSLKNLGKMALTAGPKVVDAFLPNSLQTTPKLEAIEGLQSHRQKKLQKAERDCQDDLRTIERGYEAISAYVDNFYGDLIVPFDYTDGDRLQGFIKECQSFKDSIHYKNVRRIIELRSQARIDRYNEERDQILADHTDEDMIAEIRKSSWLLSAIDSHRVKASAAKAAKEKIETKFDQMTDDRPPTASNDGGGGRRKGGNWLRGLATAAALAIGALVVGGGKDSAERNVDNVATAAASSTASPNSKPAEQIEMPSVKTATRFQSAKPDQPEKTAVKENKVTASLSRPHRPQALRAKTLPPAAKLPEISPREVYEPETTVTTEKPQEHPEELLNEEQKLAQLRLLEGKTHAYKKRVSNIRKDSHNYPGNTDTGRAINRDLGAINSSLDLIMAEMKTLERQDQITKIDSKLAGIDRMLTRLDRRVVAINVAYASTSALSGRDLFKQTQQLAAQHGASFSIEHNDPKTRATTTYNVNLETINKRLQEIHSQSLNSQHLSPQQARMLQKDAQYWVGYLKFVNWNLQYNSTKVQKAA